MCSDLASYQVHLSPEPKQGRPGGAVGAAFLPSQKGGMAGSGSGLGKALEMNVENITLSERPNYKGPPIV